MISGRPAAISAAALSTRSVASSDDAFRQVDDHLQFGLVVEGQELDRDVLGVDQGERAEGGDADHQEESPGAGPAGEDRGGDQTIAAPQHAAGAMGGRVMVAVTRLAGDLYHQPRGEHDGNEEGKDHGRRGVGRNGAHIGAHQAGDEQHGQQRGDHRQGRHDGRIADLGDRIDGGLEARAVVVHGPVAGNVLDHHDGIVDQDADGKDQGKQADAVDGVAHDPGGKQRQQDGGGDDDGHHQRLAQPMETATRTTIETVARARWNSSSLALSLADSP